jgi:hypothetical protein
VAKNEENTSTDDAVLEMLLDLSDQDGLEIGITLNINGVIIEGTLVGPKTYYEGIVYSAEQISDVTLSKVLHKKFSDLKEAYVKEKEDSKSKNKKDMIATFIHLKNAKYIVNNQLPIQQNTIWWRGRIDAIDAFSFQL